MAQRTQSGRALSYIEGWHAIAEANRIFGFGAWDRETLELRQVAEHQRKVGQGEGWGVSYIARVRVRVMTPGGDGITREGVGTGHGIDRDLGLAHESAAKEAETDAMKRALMTFGNPFGLALYDKTQANVGHDTPANAEPVRVDVEQAAVTEAMRGWAKQTIDAAAQWNDEEALRAWQADKRNQKGLQKLDEAAPELAEQVRAAIAERADYLLARFARAG